MISIWRRLYRGDVDVDFPRYWNRALIASAIVVGAGLVALVVNGLNLSIDFTGGAVWEVPSDELTVDDARSVLDDFDKGSNSKIQVVENADGDRIVRIQAEESKSISESEEIAAALADAAGVDLDEVGTNTVGPSWGGKITRDAAKALVVFLVVVALYISWQLEARMAASAIIAVIHDVVLTVGVYAIFQFAVTPATVISFLTILGYSLYDTIVVYDRVIENCDRYERTGQYTFTAIIRRSLNQVLMRSINTTLSTVVPVLSILVIGGVFYGQAVMFDFSLALFIGLLAGTYSSIFVASPVVTVLKEREPHYRRIRERARSRGVEDEADHIVPGEPSRGATVPRGDAMATPRAAVSAKAGSDVESKAALYQRSHPPRPRKGRKR